MLLGQPRRTARFPQRFERFFDFLPGRVLRAGVFRFLERVHRFENRPLQRDGGRGHGDPFRVRERRVPTHVVRRDQVEEFLVCHPAIRDRTAQGVLREQRPDVDPRALDVDAEHGTAVAHLRLEQLQGGGARERPLDAREGHRQLSSRRRLRLARRGWRFGRRVSASRSIALLRRHRLQQQEQEHGGGTHELFFRRPTLIPGLRRKVPRPSALTPVYNAGLTRLSEGPRSTPRSQ